MPPHAAFGTLNLESRIQKPGSIHQDAGCIILDVGSWDLDEDPGFAVLDPQDSGCWLIDAGPGIPAPGSRILDMIRDPDPGL